MKQTVTITSKFQVHIPKAIRQKAGFMTHGPVVMRADRGKIVIEKKKEKSFLDLAGTFKPKRNMKKIDIDHIRDYIDYSDL
ncbi:AbrB/MazE/SpoVT family DNA-binding domain-containing protein [Candidatus Gottesmanbacteria bacterium]|nr:AbrB/MazE/SpoVT family DNA-binding domain-containing protein [Candidatus Gottesmanbacteria bacterium]